MAVAAAAMAAPLLVLFYGAVELFVFFLSCTQLMAFIDFRAASRRATG